jgi:UDP-3-O-[3-hydroxymyristoyl] glucosamine N-acyltransferase
MRVSELAARLEVPVEGDGSVDVRRVASLDKAGPGDLAFLGDRKQQAKALATKASAIILGPSAQGPAIPVLRAKDPYLAFARALEVLHPVPRPAEPGVHPSAVIAKSAKIGPGAAIGAYVVVGEDVVVGKNVCLAPHVVLHRGVVLGDDVVLHSHVVVREHCRLGNRVLLQNHVVVGSDGFGFTRRPDGTQQKIPQVGVVVLEDDVEIQAGTTVDRGTLEETRVGRGAKVDNLVQIAHNCVVGPDSILCGQVGLSGSTTIGRGVTMAGQSGTGGHLTIGDGATVVAKSGVAGDIAPGATVGGMPASDLREAMRYNLALPKLPDLLKDFRELKKKVEDLEGKVAGTGGDGAGAAR